MKVSRRQFLAAAGATAAALAIPPAVSSVVRSARASGQQPNIVIFLTDDQDVASMPVMRNLMSRPYGNWVNYTHFYTNQALCCPSRATLLTGQHTHNHRVLGIGRPEDFDDSSTLATWLHDAGYHTAFMGKYLLGWGGGASPGWDVWVKKGAPIDKHIAMADDFIRDSVATTDAPFFIIVSFSAPHVPANPGRYKGVTPWVPPDPPNYNEADVSDKPLVIRNKNLITGKRWRTERQNSQRELMMIDDGVQKILDTLHDVGELDNTVVVFTADNGFSWGSHRYALKNMPYEECSRVPLMIRWPGLGDNRDENRLVSNVDLAPTLAEAGQATVGHQTDGRSMMGMTFDPGQEWPEAVLLERRRGPDLAQYFGIRVPGWMYTEYNNGDKELYDMVADPYQMTNIVNVPEYAAVRDQLAQQMRDMIAGQP